MHHIVSVIIVIVSITGAAILGCTGTSKIAQEGVRDEVFDPLAHRLSSPSEWRIVPASDSRGCHFRAGESPPDELVRGQREVSGLGPPE